MNLKSYTKRRMVFGALAAFACASFAAQAETVNLAGESLTVEDIAAANDYVNTSDTAATLTLDTDEDVTFGGTVAGNIAIVKNGAGTVTFANDNTHSGGTTINEGYIAVDAESRLGTGTVKFNGGGLNVTKSFLQTKVVFDFKDGRHGTVHTPEGVTFSISNKLFITTSTGSFTKTGAGTLDLEGTFRSNFSNDRWIIEEGTIYFSNGSVWAGHATEAPSVTLEIRENAILRTAGHTALPNIVMRGGTFYHDGYTVKIEGKENDKDGWTCFSFRQALSVLPSENGKPSRIIAEHCYAGHGNLIPLFNVQEGAELSVETKLEGGFDSTGKVRIGGGFVKTGKGTMTLCQPCNFDGGSVRVEEGTLRIKRGASFTPDTKLTVSKNARIALDEGVALDCPVMGDSKIQSAVLADADVWMDATAIPGAYGQKVDSVPNKGKAGGSFGKFTAGTIPNAPVLRASAFNNRPALYFDLTSMLLLESYTNKTPYITVCTVGNCVAPTKWYGYLSMKANDAKVDGGSSGQFHIEDSAPKDKKRLFLRTSSTVTGGITLSDAAIANTPFFDFYESSDTERSAFQYTANGLVAGENKDSLSFPRFDIERVGIGGRLGANGEAQNNRTYNGYIGELLIWSRLLTDPEKAEVSAYLKSKWFGVEPEIATVETAPVTVDIPNGLGGVSKVEGGLVKEGEGTLALGNAADAEDVRINEGALALLPTSLVHKVSVWVDATDSSTLTVEDGKVVAIRNKGSCGGMFLRNTRGGETSPGVPALAKDINGLQSISFDGNSALALNSYVNKNPDRRLQIFMVAQHTADTDLTSNKKGCYSGAFSIESTKVDALDYNQITAPHIQEQIVKDKNGVLQKYVRFYVGKNTHAEIKPADFYTDAKEKPFLISAAMGTTAAWLCIEMMDGTQKSVTKEKVSSLDTPALDLDIVQLGGRLGAYGAAQWVANNSNNNRMWVGSIGEFIVCDAILSTPEQKALQNYLRAKWFNGNANAEKPVALGTAIVPALAEDVNLSMAEGTKLESHVATLPLGSLEVEGSATFARGGVTDSSAYAMFSVGGDVELPSAMTFIPLSLPDSNYAALISGIAQSTTAWTVGDGTSSKWKVNSTANGIALSKPGMSIVIR